MMKASQKLLKHNNLFIALVFLYIKGQLFG